MSDDGVLIVKRMLDREIGGYSNPEGYTIIEDSEHSPHNRKWLLSLHGRILSYFHTLHEAQYYAGSYQHDMDLLRGG